MKKVSDVFKSIRFAKLDPKHDKGPKISTDDEQHYTVGEKEFQQQLDHVKKRAMQEEKKDKYDEGEYDREGDMAKSDLRSIVANAQKLHDMIDDADNLPEWCQSKITLAEDYVSTVANYMTAEMNEEVIEEGRPSQRHPLEGHDYHKKTDAELTYIAKDAHKAAESMKSHNTDAENKYRDQANDSATVRYWRKKHGMPEWYKKKYGHIKEETDICPECKEDPCACNQVEEGAFSSGQLKPTEKLKQLAAKVPSSGTIRSKDEKGVYTSHIVNGKEVKRVYEEAGQIDEISKKLLGNYVKGAVADVGASRSLAGTFAAKEKSAKTERMKNANQSLANKFKTSAIKRQKGINKAVDRLSKEEAELDEGIYNKDVERAFPASGVKTGASAPKGTSTMPKDPKKAKGQPAGGVKEESEQIDEIIKQDVQTDMQTMDKMAFVKKHGVTKSKAKILAKEQREKEDPPFDPDPPNKKPSATPGKYGSGYSTARHLARMAMQRQAEKYKKPVKEESELSNKAKIVKNVAKKKDSDEKFQAEPVLSKTITKNY